MLIKCPNNCDKRRFFVSAHVKETWEVDEEAKWLSTFECTDVTLPPTTESFFVCVECGEEGKAEDNNGI